MNKTRLLHFWYWILHGVPETCEHAILPYGFVLEREKKKIKIYLDAYCIIQKFKLLEHNMSICQVLLAQQKTVHSQWNCTHAVYTASGTISVVHEAHGTTHFLQSWKSSRRRTNNYFTSWHLTHWNIISEDTVIKTEYCMRHSKSQYS